MSASDEQGQSPVIRDRRRIDPVTGQPRDPAGQPRDPAGQPAGSAGDGEGTRPGQARPGRHAVSKPGGARARSGGPAGPGGPGGTAGTSQADQPEAANAANSGAAASGTTGPGTAASGTAASDTAASGAAASDTAGPGTAASGAAANGTCGGDAAAGSGAASPGQADGDLAVKLAERTADVQRVQAEYANYRKRVERDRSAVREHALASVLSELLPVLDDIGRAREHGELTGGFKAVAEALEAIMAKLGLATFGEAGEPFDPNVHEALMHSYSAEVTEPTSVQILQPGYKVGERILRPARVAVAEPTDPAGARTGDQQAGQAEQAEQAEQAGQAAGTAAASGDATAGEAGKSGNDAD